MTELKNSFHAVDHPIVQARLAPLEPDGSEASNLLHVNTATRVEDEYEAATSEPEAVTYDLNDVSVLMPSDQLQKEKVIGAGVASGVLGLVVGGPVLGLALGFGAAHATSKEGALGDTARAVGDIAVSAQAKAKEIDARHNVVERGTAAAQDAWDRAQELDQENQYLKRSGECIAKTWKFLVRFVHEHNLIERGVNTVGRAVVWAAEAIGNKIKESQQNANSVAQEQSAS